MNKKLQNNKTDTTTQLTYSSEIGSSPPTPEVLFEKV